MHNLTHSCSFPLYETDIHECLSSGHQKCGSHKEKDLGCTEDAEVFPSQTSEAYPTPDWQYADERYHAKGQFHLIAFQGISTLWRIAAPSATKKLTIPLCSSLLVSISNAGRTHFYTTLTSRTIKKQLCGPVHVSYPTSGSIDT